MTIIELIRAFAHDDAVAVVITDTELAPPGPTILYANQAFATLTGRPLDEVIGINPRFMQGRETRRPTLEAFRRALAAGERFHGFLTNYQADGTKYVAEIDCRPLRNAEDRTEYFLAFEREVVRRRGRPLSSQFGRYEPVSVNNEALTTAFAGMGVFSS
jgi:PAS domain S-box-containing protein